MSIKDETFTLNNGSVIPSIGFGTAPLKGDEAYEAVLNALKAGYRHIDTAQAYQNEKDVGRAIADFGIAREDLFITTKLEASIKTYEGAIKALESSLENLNTDYVDLYLIHAPWPWDDKYSNHKEGNVEAYKALEYLYEIGKAKAIGISNFNVDDTKNILEHCSVVPQVNQIKYHIGHNQKEVHDYCSKHDILIEAYSPLGRGKILQHEVLVDMAEKYNVSTAKLSLRYILQKDVLPLPRSNNPKNISNNLALDFTLDKKDIESLDQLDIESIEFGKVKSKNKQ